MQLIFETETTVNIVDKMTSIDTMPVAESKPDSPPDAIKVFKCNSMDTNNLEVDTVKPDENGTPKELNGDTTNTMNESPETSGDVIHKDKENNTSAQNGNVATTAKIDTICRVATEDTEHVQVEPKSENLMQVEESPLKSPENLEVTSEDLLKAENKNEIKDTTPNNGDDDVIKPEVVKENGDENKITSEDDNNSDIRENISFQPEIQNENTLVDIDETKVVKSVSAKINGDNSVANLDNPISDVDTNETQLDDKELTEARSPEEETVTADCASEQKLTSTDPLEGSNIPTEMEINDTNTQRDNVTTPDNAHEEKVKPADVIQDSQMEACGHEDNIKASDETQENKMKTTDEDGIKSIDETEVRKMDVIDHHEEKKAADEIQDDKMKSSDHEEEKTNDLQVNKVCEVTDHNQKIIDETQENKVEATNLQEIKAIDDTQENKMEVTDNQEEKNSNKVTVENKTDSAESIKGIKATNASEDENMEVTEQEERLTPTDKTQEKRIDLTNNEDLLKSTNEVQENAKESSDQIHSSEEKNKSDTLQCVNKIEDDNSKDSILNVNSDSLRSNACDESILNSGEEQNSIKEIEENCVDDSKRIESDINIGSNVNNDTKNINVFDKKDNSETKDISENNVDSPKQVKDKEVKATPSEPMDVDASEDLTSDNPAVFSKTETSNDALFDQLLSEEIISVNSNKTVNLDSDRKSSPVTVIDCDDILDTGDETSQNAENQPAKPKEKMPSKPQKTNSISGLSNTLDILSDDDDCVEECKEKMPEKPESTANENKCINLDEDDDVMLIDDSPNEKDLVEPKITEYMKPQDSESVNKENEDDKHKSDQMNTINLDNDSEPEISKTSTKDDVCKDAVADVPLDEDSKSKSPEIGEKLEKPASPKPVQRPIIPEHFLKAFRKNVVDMNRDELEEFCLMKIVEGIIDQTNLSEVKTKLKTMSSYLEEWKKKVTALTKQNRDLQIVLKTVQDEQKKRSEHQVVPLKITRSVGMQVYMAEVADKNAAKRKALPPTPVRNNRNPPSKPTGKQNSNTPIPVPRLVPAPNNSPMKGRHPPQVQNATVTSNSPKQYAQNGIKTPSPAQKSEKRPFSSVQSVTVDLTDDEPPAKQPAPARNNAQAPVRLVAQQQLMKPRAQVGVGNTGARKVFIPINPQSHIRPGQTITLKSVPPNGRIRGPGAQNQALPIRVQANAIRGPRPNTNLRHPAPLPEVAKQQQPPNWKALPPAPDLKISKVENGIVISWKIEGYQEDSYEEIASYQLYAYQETSSPPSTLLWKKIGDVKALPLPMACTLTQFMAGYKYYFAVRAVDIRSRIGTFSLPGSILLLNK